MHRVRDDALLCDRSDKKRIELNNYRAVELELFKSFEAFRSGDESQNPFTRTFLCQLHALVVDGLYPCGGHIREDATDLVQINASFEPKSPADIRLKLPDLLLECEQYVTQCNDPSGPHPSEFERSEFSARTLHKYMVLHPFRGGNGRVGRALLDILLARLGLIVPPMTLMYYCGRYRNGYFHGLKQADKGNIALLRDYILRGVNEARFDVIMDQVQRRENDPILGPKLRPILRGHRNILDQDRRAELNDDHFFRLLDKTLKALDRALSKALAEASELR